MKSKGTRERKKRKHLGCADTADVAIQRSGTNWLYCIFREVERATEDGEMAQGGTFVLYSTQKRWSCAGITYLRRVQDAANGSPEVANRRERPSTTCECCLHSTVRCLRAHLWEVVRLLEVLARQVSFLDGNNEHPASGLLVMGAVIIILDGRMMMLDRKSWSSAGSERIATLVLYCRVVLIRYSRANCS